VGAFAIGGTAPAMSGFRSEVVGDWNAVRLRHATELRPVIAAARAAASVDAHVLGERRVRSTRYFAEVVRPHGGRETLCAIPIWRDRPVGYLWLGRCGRLGRFEARDLTKVNGLLPAIAMATAAGWKAAPEGVPISLSPRETQIIDLLRRGLCSREIAFVLGNSPNTVRNQIWKLMARVGASTRAEVVALCRPGDE
jgi:DNA-binding CsgD family transcriptional regulator